MKALPIFRNIGNHVPFDRILDSSATSLPESKISQMSFQHLRLDLIMLCYVMLLRYVGLG
jgi:hypothetical protein